MAEQKKETTLGTQTGDQIEILKKEKEALERVVKEQQLLMLDQMVQKKDDPFSKPIMANETDTVEKIAQMRHKHLHGGGLSQKEANELYRLENELAVNRGNTLGYQDRGNICDEDMVPRTTTDRLKLNFTVPNGYAAYTEVDTKSLDGRYIKEKLALGYRLMVNDGTVHCEADVNVTSPDCKDCGFVMRKAGTYIGEPATHYLMVIDKVFSEARKRKDLDDQKTNAINRIEEDIENFNRLVRDSGDSEMTGRGLRVDYNAMN